MIILIILSNSLPSTLFLILHILIGRRPAIVLSNQSLVSLSLDSLMLLVEHVWLQAQHPWNTNEGDQKQDDLNECLASVELRSILNSSRRQEHVNQHVEQVGWRGRGIRPVDGPLVDDTNDEVTKDTVEEEHLGDELGVDVEVLLEMQVVWYLQTNGEGHLIISCSPEKEGGDLRERYQ
jgi:hypothetical protein